MCRKDTKTTPSKHLLIMFALSPVSIHHHINRRRRLSVLLRKTNNLLINESSSGVTAVDNLTTHKDEKKTKKKKNEKTTSKKVKSTKRSSRSGGDKDNNRSAHRRKNRRNEDAKATTTAEESRPRKDEIRSGSFVTNDDIKNKDDYLLDNSPESPTAVTGSNRRGSFLLGNYLQNISNRSLSNVSSCEFDANVRDEDDISIHSTATGDSYACTGNIVVDLDASDHFVAPALEAGHDAAPESPTRSSIRSLSSSLSSPSLTLTSSRQAKLRSLDRGQEPQCEQADQTPSTPSSRSRRMTLRQSMLQRYNSRLSATTSSHSRRSSSTKITSSNGASFIKQLPFGKDDDDDALKKNHSFHDDLDDSCSETLATYDESSSSNTMNCWSSNAPLSPSFSNHHRLSSTMDFSPVAIPSPDRSSSRNLERDIFAGLDISEQQELLHEEVLEMESVLKVLQETLGFDPVETVGSRHPSFASSSPLSMSLQMGVPPPPPPPPPSPGMLSVIASLSLDNEQMTPRSISRPMRKSLRKTETVDKKEKQAQVKPRRSLSNVTQSTESTASSSSSTAEVAVDLHFCDELSCMKEEEEEDDMLSQPHEADTKNATKSMEADVVVASEKSDSVLPSPPEVDFGGEDDDAEEGEVDGGETLLQREIKEMELVMKVLKEKIGFNPVATVVSSHPSFTSTCRSLPLVGLSPGSPPASPSVKNSGSLTSCDDVESMPIKSSKNDASKGELKAVMEEMESILLTMKLEEVASSRKDKNKKKKKMKKSPSTAASPESTSSKKKKKKRSSKTSKNKRTSNSTSTLSTASLSSHSAHSFC